MVYRNQHDPTNPIVYMDIAIGDEISGRMIIELRADVVPRTAENFLRLCNGTAGVGSFCKKNLTYEGTNFHKVQRTFAIQGGDVAKNNGRSGESIYGRFFDDENFTLSNEVGAVGMANFGRPNTNNSQFYIASVESTHLDGTNVVVGYILRGFGIISEMEKFAGNEHIDDHKPTRSIRIHKCGQLQPGESWGICETDNMPDKIPPYPLDWEQTRAPEMSFEQMLLVLEDIKASAKLSFQAKDYINAGRRYKKLNRYYQDFISKIEWADKEKREKLNAIDRLNCENLSLVEIKLNHWKGALELCNIVLKHDQNNCRAIFRRGKANIELENYDDGLRDIKRAKLLNPKDNIIETELQNAQRLWKLYIAKQRQKYKKMFN